MSGPARDRPRDHEERAREARTGSWSRLGGVLQAVSET